jgi:hypothetical protein
VHIFVHLSCSLVVTAAGILGISVNDALEAYGNYFIQHVQGQVRAGMQAAGAALVAEAAAARTADAAACGTADVEPHTHSSCYGHTKRAAA